MRCQPGRRNPKKGEDKMIPDKTKGARRPERDTDGTNVAPSPWGKVYELHSTNGPDRSSSDADQR